MREKITNFLINFKEIASKNGILLWRNPNNLETLGYLGITKKNLEEILIGLSAEDCCSPPEQDHSGRGEVFFFGKRVNGYDIYIKLKILNGDRVLCMSFHISKKPLDFPLKKKVEGKNEE